MAFTIQSIFGNWENLILFGLFFLFFVVGIIVTIIFLSKRKWDYKVIVLENVAGAGYQPTRRDRAKLVSFGDGGEEIFYLKRAKKYRVSYGKRVGNKYIAWCIGDDGYWYNITFGDVNKKLMEIGVNPVERDMRLAHVSLRKGIEQRYNDKNFFEKYGAAITIGMLIFAIIAFGATSYFIFEQYKKVSAGNLEAIKASKEVMQLAADTLKNIDNIKGGAGSGIIPV